MKLITCLYIAQAGKCAICGEFMQHGTYNIDHVIPRRYGGKRSKNNICATHEKCNVKKAHKYPTQEYMDRAKENYRIAKRLNKMLNHNLLAVTIKKN